MAIKKSAQSQYLAPGTTPPINLAEWDILAYQQRTARRHVELRSMAPSFSAHDTNGNTASPYWDVHSTPTRIVRVWLDGNNLRTHCLLAEPDVYSANSWSSTTTLSTSALATTRPVVAGYDGHWIIAALSTTLGTVLIYRSTDGISWSADATYAPSTPYFATSGATPYFDTVDGTKKIFIGLAEGKQGSYGAVDVLYIALPLTTGNTLIAFFNSGSLYTTNIFYPYDFKSFDVQAFNDPYSGNLGSNNYDSSARHMIVAETRTPSYFTYQSGANGSAPVSSEEQCGGLIGWVVRPPTSNVGVFAIAPSHTNIEVFQPQWPFQYRSLAHLDTTPSQLGELDPYDQMILCAVSSDSDHNQADTVYYTRGLVFYTSRDGLHWSQCEYLDYTQLWAGASGANVQNYGFAMVKCGHYLYILDAQNCYISQSTAQFGEIHPANTVDLTSRINSYSSEMSNMRQTRLVCDNKDGWFQTHAPFQNIHAWMLVTQFGDANWLQTVSTEIVDTIQASKERPDEWVEITARGMAAALTDYKHSTDALQYDMPNARIDTFANLNSVENSGLGHMAAQAGTFGTDQFGDLQLLESMKDNIAFSTFSDNVQNGYVQATMRFPANLPTTFTSAVPPNAFIGIVFRGLDKSNYLCLGWFYNDITYPLKLFSVGYGVITHLAAFDWALPAGHSGIASKADILAGLASFTLGLEFYYNLVTPFIIDPNGIMWDVSTYQTGFLGTQLLGSGQFTAYPNYRLLTAGYVGVAGNFFADQGSDNIEINTSCSGNNAIFTIVNIGTSQFDATMTYTVINRTGSIIANGAVNQLNPGETQVVSVGSLGVPVTMTIIDTISGSSVTQAEATDDCGTAEFNGVHMWDFTQGQSDWQVIPVEVGYANDGLPGLTGSYIPGSGFKSNARSAAISGGGWLGLEIKLTFPATRIGFMTIEGHNFTGNFGNFNILGYLGGVQQYGQPTGNLPAGVDIPYSEQGRNSYFTCDELRVVFNMNLAGTTPGLWNVYVTKITLCTNGVDGITSGAAGDPADCL